MSDLEVVGSQSDDVVVATATEYSTERAVFGTLQLVRRVIATAYETSDGDPTLLVLLRTHNSITTGQQSYRRQSIDELAYNALIELSLSQEPGDWWSKLETFQITQTLSAYAPDLFDNNDDDDDGDEANDRYLFKTDIAAEKTANARAGNPCMLAALHKWLLLSFPKRRYAIPVQLVETQAGDDLALWYKKYPALGRVQLRSTTRYLTLHSRASEIHSKRLLKNCFSKWLSGAATKQARRFKALRFRMKVLFARWQRLISQKSEHWLIYFKAFAEWKYQAYYDSRMRQYFRKWRKQSRFSKRRNIVFAYRVGNVWLCNKRWAFGKLRSNESSYRRRWTLNVTRKFFQRWYIVHVEWRKKADHAANWIRVLDRVMITKSLNAWMIYTTSCIRRKQALAHIIHNANYKKTCDAFRRLSGTQFKPASPLENDEEEDWIAMLIQRHDQALKSVLRESRM